MLTIAADADNNSDIGIDIDSNLVVRAFIYEQKSEYYLSNSDYFWARGRRLPPVLSIYQDGWADSENYVNGMF